MKKALFQLKRFAGVGREGFSQCVNLYVHLRHIPMWHTLFQQSHMTCKEIRCIAVEIRVGCSNGSLVFLLADFDMIEFPTTYEVDHCACQNGIYREADSSQHAGQRLQSEFVNDCLLYTAHILRRPIAKQHVLSPPRVADIRKEVYLRPMMHDDAEIVITV